MVIAELDHKRKRYIAVFITISRQDTKEIADWMSRKMREDCKADTTEESLRKLKNLCANKFGEEPMIVEKNDIPIIKWR